jgi:hypothetical protein
MKDESKDAERELHGPKVEGVSIPLYQNCRGQCRAFAFQQSYLALIFYCTVSIWLLQPLLSAYPIAQVLVPLLEETSPTADPSHPVCHDAD